MVGLAYRGPKIEAATRDFLRAAGSDHPLSVRAVEAFARGQGRPVRELLPKFSSGR